MASCVCLREKLVELNFQSPLLLEYALSSLDEESLSEEDNTGIDNESALFLRSLPFLLLLSPEAAAAELLLDISQSCFSGC